MSKHTPGPWFLDQYGHVYGWDIPQPHMGISTSVHICTPLTNFADRALIAAAPDLLEALLTLRDFAVMSNARQIAYLDAGNQHPVEVAQAAIAKAGA